MDDGTVARLDDETFYVTTTSTGADGVYQWFTWWNAVWFMDVRFAADGGGVRDQRRWPRARADAAGLGDDFSNEGLGYLDARHSA